MSEIFVDSLQLELQRSSHARQQIPCYYYPTKIQSNLSEAFVPKGRAKIISSKMVYQGKVFGVRQDVVVEPGGKPTARDIVTHPGSVVVLPVLNDGRLLMIRQYRHTVGGFLLEVVAGRKEAGENNLKAAKRELAEETGYRAKHFRE